MTDPVREAYEKYKKTTDIDDDPYVAGPYSWAAFQAGYNSASAWQEITMPPVIDRALLLIRVYPNQDEFEPYEKIIIGGFDTTLDQFTDDYGNKVEGSILAFRELPEIGSQLGGE